MNLFTQLLHLVGSGAVAYVTARNLRDAQTRPNVLAGFHLAEAGSVPFLEALSQRAADEGDVWLAERLAKHAQDERRHGQIFAHGLKQHNKQVIDFQSVPKEDNRRRSPFFEAYFKDYSQTNLSPQNIDWTVFFASTYILEVDASKDFLRMANALPDNDPRCANLQKGIVSIAQDEKGHAAYLYEAMHRRMPHAQVVDLIDEWRTRKVNAMMAMVSNLMNQGGNIPSLVQDGVPTELAETAAEEPAIAA
jgi:rubrerythrin